MQTWMLPFVLLLVNLLTACGDNVPDQGSAPQAARPGDTSDTSAATLLPGFTFADLDPAIRPQDDFWNFVNSRWIETTEIPGDRSSYGTFHQINDRTEAQIKALLENAVSQTKPNALEIAVGDLYGSFMDMESIEAAGLAPLDPFVAQIDAIRTPQQLIRVLGEFTAMGVTTPFGFFTDGDAFDATRVMVYLWQGGTGLPDRSYYLDDNPKLVAARDAYRQHIQAMFDAVGWNEGQQASAAILEIETALAKLQWTRLQTRDRQKIYSNQLSFAQAEAAAPGVDLQAWFDGYAAPLPGTLVIGQDSYFAGLGEVLAQTPLSAWRDYLKFHVLKSLAAFLPERIVALDFEFQGRELRGQTEQAERWRRGVRFVNQTAGELLGQIYVQKHFDEQAKAEISTLVENLRKAFAVSIRNLEWMSDATKQQALIKLDKFLPKLGYPDAWRDFSGLSTQRNDLVANVLSAHRFAHAYELELLAQPVDKHRWNIYPQMVNAFYRPTHNTITFPAGILQLPMFASGRDPAMNYGAIGAGIGHEFSHGFDDQGRKFDGDGMLRNWWTDADAEEYRARAEVLVAQYAQFQPLPDTAVNGELTLGENIGDLAGILMAYRAFELSGHADGPAINGYTPRQRFFISYAIAWRNKIRPQYLRELLLRDTHSPAEYRVTGILRNTPGFYEAFSVQAGDGMYLPEQARARIW